MRYYFTPTTGYNKKKKEKKKNRKIIHIGEDEEKLKTLYTTVEMYNGAMENTLAVPKNVKTK